MANVLEGLVYWETLSISCLSSLLILHSMSEMILDFDIEVLYPNSRDPGEFPPARIPRERLPCRQNMGNSQSLQKALSLLKPNNTREKISYRAKISRKRALN